MRKNRRSTKYSLEYSINIRIEVETGSQTCIHPRFQFDYSKVTNDRNYRKGVPQIFDAQTDTIEIPAPIEKTHPETIYLIGQNKVGQN